MVDCCDDTEANPSNCCKKVKPPKCGSEEKCANCSCTKIDARLCLPCKHRFCHSCIEKMLPLDCPSLTSCPVCDCDVERLKFPNSITQSSADPCGEKGQCYRSSPTPCDEWFCYNCYTEGCSKVRAKEFCLDCDVSMCEKHLQQHKSFIRKKKHNMLPVCQYKLMKRKFECRRCKIHPKYTLLFVCNKCDMIVCQVCVACIECEKGGRHVAQELDTVALEMATAINQGMKDVDCVRKSGEKVIAEAFKVYQCKESELEKTKQAVCREFEMKSSELCRMKEKLLCEISDLMKKNKRATNAHKNKIQEVMCEAKNTATKASQLLCYSHNVDIASQARNMLTELDCIKCTDFPCLDLEGYKLGQREVELKMPCLSQDEETITNFCPQPTIPEPKSQDPCDPCSKPKTQCSPVSCPNPSAMPLPNDLERCERPYDKVSACDDAKAVSDLMASYYSKGRNNSPNSAYASACSNVSSPSEDDECETPQGDLCEEMFPLKAEDCNAISSMYSTSYRSGKAYECDTIKFTLCDMDMLSKGACSKQVCISDMLWNIMLVIEKNPNDVCDNRDYLGFFIQCESPTADRYWSCDAEVDCKLINQVEPSNTECKRFSHRFCCDKRSYGIVSYMKLCDVLDPTNGFIKKRKILVEAKIRAQIKDNCGNL